MLLPAAYFQKNVLIYPQTAQSDDFKVIYLVVSLAFLIMSLIVIYFFTEICAYFHHQKRAFILESNYSILEEQMSLQSQMSKKLKIMRHDIRNHISNISFLLKKGAVDEAIQILEKIKGDTGKLNIGFLESTGNNIIDIIVSYKAAVCEKRNIKFKYRYEAIPKLKISAADISSLLSNLLDNAVEAAEKSEERFIELDILMYKNYLSVIVKNSFASYELNNRGLLTSTKKDKEYHGYGMEIISEIAKKYDGRFSWESNGNTFISKAHVKDTEVK